MIFKIGLYDFEVMCTDLVCNGSSGFYTLRVLIYIRSETGCFSDCIFDFNSTVFITVLRQILPQCFPFV